MDYPALVLSYYRPLWEMGIDVDIIDMDEELDGYKIVIAPINYLYRKGYTEKVHIFVEEGGCYLTTYWSGEVDDTDLCFVGEHPLREVLGLRTEEIDAPGDYYKNSVVYDGNEYDIKGLCSLVHAEGADVLAKYEKYQRILSQAGVYSGFKSELPEGVTITEQAEKVVGRFGFFRISIEKALW